MAEESRGDLSALAEAAPAVGNLSLLSHPWLRMAYALEFLIALVAIISLWSEIGGEGHLDLMPWYVKLGCILGLDWCCVRFTAGMVEQQAVWTGRTIRWFFGILLFCLLMGGITYYYHLHEEPDDGNDDTTAAAEKIDNLGPFLNDASKTTCSSLPICCMAHSTFSAGDRVPAGSPGRDSRLRM